MGLHTNLSHCTIQRPDGEPCGRPSARDMPFPICGTHAADLFRHIATIMGSMVDDPAFRAQWFMEHAQRDHAELDAHAQAEHHVYYVLVADMVKIGRTTHLKQRIRSYPPGSRLLAVEDGDHRLEARRHAQFAHLRVAGNEWYRPDGELLEFIDGLRARRNQPPVRGEAAPAQLRARRNVRMNPSR